MDETESDYSLRLLVKAAQYYKEHMKVKSIYDFSVDLSY